ncbi:MAG: HlyC/CorC family transporter [Bacteroidales bacterium]|nr:HlyC/CorC family transporter [Bacteroidales bacterium]
MIILISLIFSAFFSGMEIAFISSNKLRIEVDRKKGVLGSKIISFFTDNTRQYIATMLVGNNIALVIYGIVMAILLEPFIAVITQSESLILAVQTILSTLIILITAEFLPKTLFSINPNIALKVFVFPILFFYILLYPITKLIIALSNLVFRAFRGFPENDTNGSSVFGRVDLNHLVSEHKYKEQYELDDEHEIRIFQNALDFSNVKLRDCMIPRTEIVALEDNCSVEDLKQRFIETGLSKILIYKESTDNVIGYINARTLFKSPSEIHALINSMPIVPESMPAKKLLQSLIKQQISIALVVDEFGGTSGIVTIEDILEEIFGEIEDEHDTSEFTEEQISEYEFMFSGRLEIDYLNDKYRLNIPEKDEYETLAGFILYHHENIPGINDRLEIESFIVKILDVSETRIELLQLTKKEI